ncbi:MAG: tRNA 2-thiouridine(34) synthase MnmA [Candidatus Berkelbacteria bacterium]|nr:tRNA 2-thiouridine(34) synthase MnmA [Candidatus Berkelbacteria bacterium]
MKLAIALSGGVDSAVAAKILKDYGHDLVGLFLKLWSDPTSSAQGGLRGTSPLFPDGKTCRRDNHCCDYQALEDARAVAAKLNIPFYVINAKSEFKKAVVDYFLTEYQNLRTPNPCIICNEKIKFDLLLKKALAIGCEKLATGHYARINQRSKIKDQNDKSKSKKEYHLLKGVDETKDQSYMLYRLNQNQLAKILFPLGEMKKIDVRKLAIKYNLPVKEKPESQEICFFADKDYRNFLRRYLPEKFFLPGEIVDIEGNVVGQHQGLLNYTIGQRKLIDQKSKIKNQNDKSKIKDKKPLYVVGFNQEKNQLIVGGNNEVFKKEMIVNSLNFIHNSEFIIQNSNLSVKIRYRHSEVTCKITSHPELVEGSSDNIKVIFAEPQRAITPGQSAVIYGRSPSREARFGRAKWDEVLGGGIIES